MDEELITKVDNGMVSGRGMMEGMVAYAMNFIMDNLFNDVVNVPLLIIILMILVIAQFICIKISRKNKLYIDLSKEKDDNAYT